MLRIEGKPRDLGGFTVARLLPHHSRRLVGPFIFFDHIGPARFEPGTGMDVRPHPHIGLATVTYLFEGRIRHRDTLGSELDIGPGAVNWMTAGHGIAHSERTPADLRASGHRLHGIQSWVALPKADEQCPPSFVHHPAETLPVVEMEGARCTLIAGTAFSTRSPVAFNHPTFYLDAELAAGTTLPLPAEHAERAFYVVEGEVTTQDGETVPAGHMLVLQDGGGEAWLKANGASRVMLLGGAPMDGPRLIWWNLVASEQALIDSARAEWKADPFGGRYGRIPDESEFIPLPE
ncbi:pirin family protein [Sandaracinobacter sp. RS1-74]|uniref:pirin family protein n=1 Tax=Sandaracinobacteroides sayramensis TaxID=2913411 RepID=UPI001EDB8C4D|nr:pirin family protein [Sandaracinobacteroides sayramensis]MCG2841887.1 pirin family protein [Sandaracinobacteroides sayramensis]